MPTTSNFGWTTPADTDLVKDGAAAIRTLGNGIDTSLVDLKGGTTGQILSKNSNTDLDYTWIDNDQGDITAVTAGTGLTGGGTTGAVTLTNDMATTITASGDIVVGTGNGTYDNLPIGTTGQVLTADTTVSPYKVKWAAVSTSGPTFRAFRDTSVQSLTINTATKIAFNAESWDTDSCFDSTTNYRFTANKAGYYQFNTAISFSTGGAIGRNFLRFYKNGSEFVRLVDGPAPQQYGQMIGSALIYLNGTTDYVEVYAQLGTATTREIDPGSALTAFDGVWIRS